MFPPDPPNSAPRCSLAPGHAGETLSQRHLPSSRAQTARRSLARPGSGSTTPTPALTAEQRRGDPSSRHYHRHGHTSPATRTLMGLLTLGLRHWPCISFVALQVCELRASLTKAVQLDSLLCMAHTRARSSPSASTGACVCSSLGRCGCWAGSPGCPCPGGGSAAHKAACGAARPRSPLVLLASAASATAAAEPPAATDLP